MDRSKTLQGWWLRPAALAAMFVVALMTLLPDHLLFHPDERHYVDAGLRMTETGDWLTPRSADGELRLRKPILPYWFVAIGCDLLGPSPFSSRLLFAFAGGGIVWLSWWAARQATDSLRAATLTALIVMCHPALIISASRSLPDVVLSLFLTLSLTGFLGIVSSGRADWRLLTIAYGGGALAVLAKGAPAAVFVLYSSVFLLVKYRSLVQVHWKSFTAAALGFVTLSGSWFLAMQLLHGGVIGEQFLNDQAGSERIADHPRQIVLHALLSVAVLAASFSPALLTSLPTLILRRRDTLAILDRPVSHYLLGWCLLFLSAAACVNHVSLRYLLPLVAPLGVIFGYVLAELEGPLLRRSLRWMAWASVVLLLPLAGLAFALMNSDGPAWTVLTWGLLIACGVVLVRQMRFTSALRAVGVSAIAVHASLIVVAWGSHSLLGQSFGYEMADVLRNRSMNSTSQPMLLIGEPAHASRIRICSGGEVAVTPVRRKDVPSNLTGPVAALDPGQLPPESSEVTHVRVACGFNPVDTRTLWDAIKGGKLTALLREQRREYTVAIPVQPSGTDPIPAASNTATASTPTPASIIR